MQPLIEEFNKEENERLEKEDKKRQEVAAKEAGRERIEKEKLKLKE